MIQLEKIRFEPTGAAGDELVGVPDFHARKRVGADLFHRADFSLKKGKMSGGEGEVFINPDGIFCDFPRGVIKRSLREGFV